jgi:hypothetical protein
MSIRILDLDGSLPLQSELQVRYRPRLVAAAHWGPAIRMACSFARYRRFERDLANMVGGSSDLEGTLTFYGSGDFHHVSLALVRRQSTPINLLVIDNHPDWMRGIPFLHCGTWLYHAARLPQVERVFHVGGDVDFDNPYRWLAPWPMLQCGKIVVFPARRPYRRGRWTDVVHGPLRTDEQSAIEPGRLQDLLAPFRTELERRPLYISLDKDVMREAEAVVNWDSGHLDRPEVETVLDAFLGAAGGRLAGMDIVGDWSPVRTHGLLRRFLHLSEHPPLRIDPLQATSRNEETNLALLDWLPSANHRGNSWSIRQQRNIYVEQP